MDILLISEGVSGATTRQGKREGCAESKFRPMANGMAGSVPRGVIRDGFSQGSVMQEIWGLRKRGIRV